MAKSKKRRGAGTGAAHRARFHQFILTQAQSSPAGVADMNRALTQQFPWVNTLDGQDAADALADLRSATIAAAAGDTQALPRTLDVWAQAAGVSPGQGAPRAGVQ